MIKKNNNPTQEEIINILQKGGTGVLATDTLYGIVGRALDEKVVERIYDLKKRDQKKPFIILIQSLKDLKLFDIKINFDNKNEVDNRLSLTEEELFNKVIKKYWPGPPKAYAMRRVRPTSIVFPCQLKKYQYLHRGTNSLAFRLPDKKDLCAIIKETGPLVAPSVNPEGKNPAKNIQEAKEYFGDKVDFYQDQGQLNSEPSRLIMIKKNSQIVILR